MSRLSAMLAKRAAATTKPSASEAARELVGSYQTAGADIDGPLAGAPLAIVDLETTGVDTATAQIVEVAVVHMGLHRGAVPEVAVHSRVRPGIPIPEGAAAVHGITDEAVADAPTWREIWPAVLHATQERIPVAYNAPYDQPVISAEQERHGLIVPVHLRWGRWLDPLVLAHVADKYEKGKKLSQVAQRRGIQVDAHGAAADTVATGMVFRQLLREAITGGKLPAEARSWSVRSFLTWQRDTALAQERDRVEYLTRQGRRSGIDCPWHELEGQDTPKGARPAPVTTTCSTCGEPIVWIVTRAGRRIPCDPTVYRGSGPFAPDGAGERRTVVTDSGDIRNLYELADGDLAGRVSHFATCPHGS